MQAGRVGGGQAGPSHSPPRPPYTPLTAIGRGTHVRQDSADAFPRLTLVHAGMLVWRRRLDGSTAAPLPMHCNAVQETIAIICIV